jgi:hypothetical protein
VAFICPWGGTGGGDLTGIAGCIHVALSWAGLPLWGLGGLKDCYTGEGTGPLVDRVGLAELVVIEQHGALRVWFALHSL